VALRSRSEGGQTEHADADGPEAAAPGGEGAVGAPSSAGATQALESLFARLARPYNAVEVAEGLLGLSPKATRQLVGMITATSPQAEHLLSAMTDTIRSLATSMETQVERCVGEIRGPVLWSETISARASTFGMDDLFLCVTPSRAYDIVENRVLVAALAAVKEAAEDAGALSTEGYDSDLLRSARRSGSTAGRWLDHPSLSSVTRERPTARAVKRVRAGKKHRTYEPALEMLDVAGDPITPDQLLPYCDQRTRAQHQVLASILDELERRGMSLPPLRAEAGVLFTGPVQYLHARVLGDRTKLSGILIGRLLVDVPDRLRDRDRARAEEQLAGRAPGRKTQIVMRREDLTLAVDRAIELARG
jgi:hypothetical protein